MKRLALFLLAAAGALYAQIVDDFNPPKANCCLQGAAQNLADQLQDWNQLGRYHAANEALTKEPAPPGRVVFFGDSITDGWKLDQFFPGKPYVNRGIGGQTTAQMLVRMFPDVIDLKPAAIILLAGTNDIARNNGPQTFDQITQNIQAITELAQLHGIKVILCGLLPVSDYTQRKQIARRPPSDILKLNTWIKNYAAMVDAVYCDYFTATADDKGLLKDGYSGDGLHPNVEGYQLMVPVAEAAIKQALK
jgi:lysophospholipase L1-like esterase